jgi:hypothetical protein
VRLFERTLNGQRVVRVAERQKKVLLCREFPPHSTKDVCVRRRMPWVRGPRSKRSAQNSQAGEAKAEAALLESAKASARRAT